MPFKQKPAVELKLPIFCPFRLIDKVSSFYAFAQCVNYHPKWVKMDQNTQILNKRECGNIGPKDLTSQNRHYGTVEIKNPRI